MPRINSKFTTSHPLIERPLPSAVIYDLSVPSQTTITLPAGSKWTSGLHWHERHTEFLRLVRGSIVVSLNGKEQITRASVPSSSSSTSSSSSPLSSSRNPDNAARSESKVVRVDRHVRHEWRRADEGLDPDGEPVVVIESTGPEDEEKHLFFWNLNGAVLEHQSHSLPHSSSRTGFNFTSTREWRNWWREAVAEWFIWLRLMVIFDEFDNYPVFKFGLLPPPFATFLTRRIGSHPLWLWLQFWCEWLITHGILFLAVLVGAKLLNIKPVERKFTPDEMFKRWDGRERRRRV